jgi:phosphonopyruvate decarboxylase
MIDPAEALRVLTQAGIRFYTGVPDSLLKDLNACVADEVDASLHAVAHNEGGAVALAAGHYLATGDPGLVYMQNSGLGNAVNPLVSLSSPQVYGIPMVLMIGWRGEPGRHDEPQHAHQGRVTEEMLATLDIPTYRLTADTQDWAEVISEAVKESIRSMRPTALLVSSGTFALYQRGVAPSGDEFPRRIEALSAIVEGLSPETCYVATTGYTSRELAALRAERGEPGERDFLGVGSMGHAASIALGMALARPDLSVVCLDGDGSLAMHLGVMALVGGRRPSNLGHVLLNNRVHESVGGQASALEDVDPVAVALACGYPSATSCVTLEGLTGLVGSTSAGSGPWFLEVKISSGTIGDLPRPDGFGSRLGRLRQSLDA